MNLSDLKPEDIEVDQPAPLRLSTLHPDDVSAEGTDDPANSPITAATTGVANGASLGLAGNVGALGKTAMDAITGTRGPLAGAPLSDLAQDYSDSRDSFKNDAAKAAEAHPYVSGAGNLAGGAALTALSPVGGFIKNKLAPPGENLVIQKSEPWLRQGLSNALDEDSKRAVYQAIAKKVAKRAAQAVLLGH